MTHPFNPCPTANIKFAPAPSGSGANPIHVGDHAGMPTGALPPNTQLIRRLYYG